MSGVLINLSNKLYEDSRMRLNRSARTFGIDAIRSYDFDDIRATPFYNDNREILDQPTGMGYWLWKPYIIREALLSLPDDAIVIYSDSGIELTASPEPLLTICRQQAPVLLFGNGDHTNAAWTKRDCFILMDCDSEYYWHAPQCDAAFALFRKCAETIAFVEEWLHFCRDARILTDQPNTCGKRDLPDFIQHRRDQSVLSLLAQKHRLPLFRMPTQFGNHYKMPAVRVPGEFNCVNQYRQRQVRYYAVVPYYNSPYLQLLDHHRGQNNTVTVKKKQPPLLWRVIKKRYTRWRNRISFQRES